MAYQKQINWTFNLVQYRFIAQFMTYHRHRGRRWPVMLASLLLSACGSGQRADQPDAVVPAPRAPAKVAAAPLDEYQALAFDAGRDLIGKPAPHMTLRTIDGRAIPIGGARRRPVYLKFWATWCVTCREQMGAFKSDFARYGRDIDVVAVNTGVNDDRAAVEAYRREVGLPMPIAIDDGRLADTLHLRVTPQHVIIGRDGTIRYVGHLEDERLQRELRGAIADQPPAAARARPPATPVGDPLKPVQGGMVRIDGPGDGVPRLLFFMSPWCETYLKDSRPAIVRDCRRTRIALTRAAASGGARVVGIASALSTDVAGVRRFLDQTGFAAPVVLDENGALFRRFGVRNFPTVIRIDRDGRPAGRVSIADIDALTARAAD